jgi:exodeoxyribonuclease V alpha subunit
MKLEPPPSPAATPPGAQIVQLTIEDVVFRSDDGRFVVVRGLREPDGGVLTAVGDLGQVAIGETLRLRGRMTQHAVHGGRFQVTAFTPIVPTSRAGIARYLGSGLVPGVGPALAERLVAKFGEQTLDVITKQSSRLREVTGIGTRRAHDIAEAVRCRRDEAETMSFLHALGLGPSLARRLLKKYGDRTAQVLREDPYLVAEEVRGVGFRTADGIGRASGIPSDDPRRAAGATLHLIARAIDEGHVYADALALAGEARTLDVPEQLIAPAIAALAARGMVVIEDDAVYAPPLYTAEVRVAAAFARLSTPRREPRDTEHAVAQASEGAALSKEQRSAVLASFRSGLVVLTGGPGTGKTTTVRTLVEAHELLGHRVLLAAPTGRAAKRLSEATAREARTLHRLLEWSPQESSFARDADSPLDAELILVDEASMLDLLLADSLLDAVPPTATLVLVGDVDQLPPVGAGQALRELLASGVAQVVRLTEVFRQAQRSRIIAGAHEVLRGLPPTPSAPGERGDGELFVIRAREPEAIAEKLVEVLRRMQSSYGFDPVRDVQVLVPMRRGPVGTERLNELLQDALNPVPGARPGAFRERDKVMQLRNDYERDVFNGDLGEVRRVSAGTTWVTIDGRDVAYTPENLEDLALAYACTIHKSQGSEFPAVVVVLTSAHHVLLDRALLYTAITRAKTLAVLIGDDRAIARAAAHSESTRARSRLAERIRRAAMQVAMTHR